MTNSKYERTRSDIRRTSLEAEQDLCNEALESGAFDEISDKEWVKICERLATERREPAGPGIRCTSPNDVE